MFGNRSDAGRALGAAVEKYLRYHLPNERPLVLALPRGGVPVGLEVARAVNGDLDVLICRKIGLPWQPEFGVGAIAEDGDPIFNHDVLRQVGLTEESLAPAVERQRREVQRMQRQYRGDRPPPEVADRLVVVVDDGLATGITARAALASVRARHPRHLILAAPVCAADTLAALQNDADKIVCVEVPEALIAIGYWYHDFGQLTDDEVQSILARYSAEHAARR